MMPVFQTRYAVESFGNCFEACIASILELPLAAVPDRAALVDADQWADSVAQARGAGGEDAVLDLDLPTEYDAGEDALREWLAQRGLAWLDVDLDTSGMTANEWLAIADRVLGRGYWIAHTVSLRGWKHATVWRGCELVHNPHRGETDPTAVGELTRASLLVAADPALLAATLSIEHARSMPTFVLEAIA